ncbi:MAG: selenoneine synthase SenA [Bradymonadaceae bacterium]
MKSNPTASELLAIVDDARRRTIDLVDDLDDDQRMGPKRDIVNPMLWEIGHLAWFHERWILRHLDGRDPLRDDADELYDSIAVHHDDRWSLPLPDYDETRDYMRGVREALHERLAGRSATEEEAYYYRYTTFHEDMHAEAFTYTRQTLEYPRPEFSAAEGGEPTASWGEQSGDVQTRRDVSVPGGTYRLGAPEDAPFAFDNEREIHEVELEPFEISKTPVTNEQFVRFVEDGGYDTREYWSDAGWAWRGETGAEAPRYWEKRDGTWHRRLFRDWYELQPDAPVVHVSWWEAKAWCRWADRRLPTEAEWEAAAAGRSAEEAGFADQKVRYPWGDRRREGRPANLDGRALLEGASGDERCLAPVGAFPEGESAFGCRQMLGNVWEWTETTFEPYPGFEPDMYEDYSAPWFGDRKVLRGGAWATRSRMVHNYWRNYFTPERRDVYAGFRTCPNG